MRKPHTQNSVTYLPGTWHGNSIHTLIYYHRKKTETSKDSFIHKFEVWAVKSNCKNTSAIQICKITSVGTGTGTGSNQETKLAVSHVTESFPLHCEIIAFPVSLLWLLKLILDNAAQLWNIGAVPSSRVTQIVHVPISTVRRKFVAQFACIFSILHFLFVWVSPFAFVFVFVFV